MGTAPHVLPDVLPCGLRAVICGTAAGDLSYRRKAYYADYRNCFWDALHEVGLTPHTLKAEVFSPFPPMAWASRTLQSLNSGRM